MNEIVLDKRSRFIELRLLLKLLYTLEPNEDYIHGLIRVHNHEICDVIDNYNSSAYCKPLPTIVRAYYNSSFN